MIPILRHTADSAGKTILRTGRKYINRIYSLQKQRVMKTKTILFTVIALFLLIGGMGCEENENLIFTDAIIIKELPKMYLTGSIKQGEQKIIQSNKELLTLFSQAEIDKFPDLQDVDFDKQTLLIGCDSYPNEANLIYEFSKKNAKEFIFRVEISGGATRPDGNFKYGIIVQKLPKTAIVNFNIVKL